MLSAAGAAMDVVHHSLLVKKSNVIMQTNEFIQEIIAFYLSHNFDKVQRLCAMGEKHYPDSPVFSLLCGMADLQTGNLDRAEAHLKRGMARNAQSPLYLEKLAEVNRLQQDKAAGSRNLYRALVLDQLMLNHYSQGGEDYLISQILTEKTGFYVDVGAHDPIALSNTYLFYEKGWTGLCLEPDPQLALNFKRVRPHDMVVTAAASNYTGKDKFFLGESSVHSSLKSNSSHQGTSIEVNVFKLEELLEKHGIGNDKIDFISIDTEGTEVDVLEGLNCNRFRPRLLLVEYVCPQGTNPEIFTYLSQYMYFPIYISRWNALFSREFEEDSATVHRFLINNRLCLLGAQQNP